MKIFEENECETVKVKGDALIYFLLKENEVVYIGQSKNGIARPMSHKDKNFDTIKILYCNQDELDRLEDRYITKYKPKYNKTLNNASSYSLMIARNKIRKEFNNFQFTIWNLRSVIKELNIELCDLNSRHYIKKEDFEKIVNHLKEDFDKEEV